MSPMIPKISGGDAERGHLDELRHDPIGAEKCSPVRAASRRRKPAEPAETAGTPRFRAR